MKPCAGSPDSSISKWLTLPPANVYSANSYDDISGQQVQFIIDYYIMIFFASISVSCFDIMS